MPAIAEPPSAPASPAAAPATAAAPDRGATVDINDDSVTTASLLSSFSPKKPEAAPKKEEVAAPKEVKAPDDKPKDEAAPKADGDKPPPKKLYQAHEELKSEYKSYKQKIEPELKTLREKVHQLESRKPEGPDPKAYESAQARIKELEGELRESAYERSPDYKRDYEDKYYSIRDEAALEAESLKVRERGPVDESGNPTYTERQGTKNDFLRILKIADPADQDAMIEQMFGRSAPRVHAQLRDLRRISREAAAAIKRERDAGELRIRERTETEERTNGERTQATQSFRENFTKEWPGIFGDSEDPKEKELIERGQGFLKDWKASATNKALTVKQRAEMDALVEASFERFPLVWGRLDAMSNENKSLKEKLAKYESGDPGGGRTASEKPSNGSGFEDKDITLKNMAGMFKKA